MRRNMGSAPAIHAVVGLVLALLAGVATAGCSCTEKPSAGIGGDGGAGADAGAAAGPALPGKPAIRVNPLDHTVSVRAVRTDAVVLIERIQEALPKRVNLILDRRAEGRLVDVDVRDRPATEAFREIARAADLDVDERGGVVSIACPPADRSAAAPPIEASPGGLYRVRSRFTYPVRVLGASVSDPQVEAERGRLNGFEGREGVSLVVSERTRDMVVREYLEERTTYEAIAERAGSARRLRSDVGPDQVRTYYETEKETFVAEVLFADTAASELVHLVYELDREFAVERLTIFATPLRNGATQ